MSYDKLILSRARTYINNRDYRKAISCYRLFKIVYGSLAGFVDVNEFVLSKKILNSKMCKYIVLEVDCGDKLYSTMFYFDKIINSISFDIEIDIENKESRYRLFAYFGVDKIAHENEDMETCLRSFFQLTNFFDDKYYRNKYHAVLNDLKPIEHYIKFGFSECNHPADWYILRQFDEMSVCKCRNVSSNIKLTVKPKVSVIVPVYNCSEFLQECIDTLTRQTLQDVEFIFVDDGSTDSSLKILQDNKDIDSRIKVLSQHNQFAGVARNKGLQLASGEYVIFLDSDDFFDLNLLEKVYNKAKKTNAEVVIFKGQEFDTQTKKFNFCKFPVSESLIPDKDSFNFRDFKETIFQANSCIAWNKLFKKSLIDRSGIEFQTLKSSNDTVFVYMLLLLAESMTFLNEILVNYRVNNCYSLQRSKSKSWECIFKAFYELRIYLKKMNLYEDVKKSFINKSVRAFLYYISTVDNDVATIMKASFKNKYMEMFDIKLHQEYYYNKGNYFELLKICDKNYVPIVYSCDKNYLGLTYISIKSIIDNASSNAILIIYVLHDDSINFINFNIFNTLRSNRCVINFINMSNLYNDVQINISHTSVATYYRLEILKILPFFDKVLYLDSDTIVRSDIQDIFLTEIDGYYAAGVKAIAFDNVSHRKRLGIDTSKYINAGVLLLNIKKMNEDNLYERLLELVGNNYSCQDQDVLNVAFAGNVLLLDKYYNFMTKYVKDKLKYKIYGEKIKIIHYADKQKPWTDSNCPFGEFFWDVACETPLYSELKGKLKDTP